METMYWSGDMIIKALKFLLPASEFENIPISIINGFKILIPVVKQKELETILHSAFSQKPDLNELIEDMKTIRKQSTFTELLGLCGVINISPLFAPLFGINSIDEPTARNKHEITTRNWLFFFAMTLFSLQRVWNSKVPACAMYIAIYEADKLARQLTENLYIELPMDLNNVVREIAETLPSCDAGPVDKNNRLEDFTSQLFDNEDYYLIPEYKHIMRSEEAATNKIIDVKATLECKPVFRSFFEKLALYHPFTTNSTPTKHKLVCTPILKMYTEVQHVVFWRSAYYCLQSVKNVAVPHNDILAVCERMNPYELMTTDDYMKWMAKQNIDTKQAKYIATPNTSLKTNHQLILPIVSPTHQLCVQSYVAFLSWTRLFTGINEKLDVSLDQLQDIRTYFEKSLEGFEPDNEKLSVIDYKKYVKLFDDWDNVTKDIKVLSKPLSEMCTLNDMANGSTFTQKLFPVLTDLYKLAVSLNYPSDVFMINCLKMMAMFIDFPKAALMFHNQKKCGILFPGTGCALDLILHSDLKKPKRCDVKLKDPLVKLFWAKHGIVEGPDGGPVKVPDTSSNQKATVGQTTFFPTSLAKPGWKRGFLNSPNTDRKAEIPFQINNPLSNSSAATQTDNVVVTNLTTLEQIKLLEQSENKLKTQFLKAKDGILALTKNLESKTEKLKTLQEENKKLRNEKLEDNREMKKRIEFLENQEILMREENINLNSEISDLKLDRENLAIDNETIYKDLAEAELTILENMENHEKEVSKLQEQLADIIKDHKKEIDKMAEEMKQLRVESACWKYNYEKVIKNDMMEESLELLGIENPVVYYTRFIEQGRNRLEEARRELRRFVSKSRFRNEKIRAERELIDFEMTVEYLQKKARTNLDILMVEPNCDMENLLKVEPYPMPFSSFIYSRMDELS